MKELWAFLKDMAWIFSLLGIVLAITILCSCASGWYSSGIQADVYERQGVKLSQWEVFWGAKPIKILEHTK